MALTSTRPASRAAFAATAWERRHCPGHGPGYIRWHRRIISASVHRSSRDGSSPAGSVRLIVSRPEAFTKANDAAWRDWPQNPHGDWQEIPADGDPRPGCGPAGHRGNAVPAARRRRAGYAGRPRR